MAFFFDLLGYAAPATLFLLLGTWHLLCSSASYSRTAHTSTPFEARAWYPISTGTISSSRHGLELYLVLLCLPFGMAYEIAMSTNTDPLVRGRTPTFRMDAFLHLALLFFMALAGAIPVLIKNSSSVSFGLAAAAFALQWKVLAFDALISPPLESCCYSLLAGIATATGFLCAGLAIQPKLFFVDLLLSISLLFQGIWRLQTWFSLHFDRFIPAGCHRLLHVPGSVKGSTQCDLESDTSRAVMIMDLLFVVHALVVTLVSFTLYAILSKVNNRNRQIGYSPMEAIPEFESCHN